MTSMYNHAILGGTFDHFHIGHEYLIKTALKQTRHLTIGIVEKPFCLDKTYFTSLESYASRLNSLNAYLLKLNALQKVSLVTINDIYGTTLVDSSIQAIFVTESTRSNAEIINIKRHEINLPTLAIEVVPYIAGDDGLIISSSRIRRGLIDRKGQSYLNFFSNKKSYQLPEHLRATLQLPIGKSITDLSLLENIIPHGSPVISVGDIVCLDLKKIGFPTAINIIDYKTRRQALDTIEIKKYFPTASATLINHAGTINREIASALLTLLADYEKSKESKLIKIDGEEDLLALPAILLSPLGSYVIYGQYNIGMIVVEVTESIKSQVKTYLEQF